MFSDDEDDEDGAEVAPAVTLNARVCTDDDDAEREGEAAAVDALRKVAVAVAARAACIIATPGVGA